MNETTLGYGLNIYDSRGNGYSEADIQRIHKYLDNPAALAPARRLKYDVVEPNEAMIAAFHAAAGLNTYQTWVVNGLRSALACAVRCGILREETPHE